MWSQLWRDSKKLLASIEENRNILGSAVVSLPDGRESAAIRADVQQAREHLEGGGKWRRFGLFTPKVIKNCIYLREDVRVDGRGATSVENLGKVAAYLDIQYAFDALEDKWNSLEGIPEVGDLKMRQASIKERIELLAGTLN